jgi:hypothetical protein
MKKTVKVLSVYSILCLVLMSNWSCMDNKMKVTYINQTAFPVNMYISGVMCTAENQVLDRGMRKDQFNLRQGKYSEMFEVAVNNHVLVRKVLEWKKEAKEIVVVYNGADVILTY